MLTAPRSQIPTQPPFSVDLQFPEPSASVRVPASGRPSATAIVIARGGYGKTTKCTLIQAHLFANPRDPPQRVFLYLYTPPIYRNSPPPPFSSSFSAFSSPVTELRRRKRAPPPATVSSPARSPFFFPWSSAGLRQARKNRLALQFSGSGKYFGHLLSGTTNR